MGSNVIFGEEWLSPSNLAMNTVVVLLMMDIAGVREAFSCLEVTLCYFATPWNIICIALCSDLCCLTTLEA